MVEYLMDRIEDDPAEEFPTRVRESGRYGRKTGDAVIDKWQEDAAMGRKVNFEEAFSDPEALREFEAAKAASRARYAARRGERAAGDIHADYTGEKKQP